MHERFETALESLEKGCQEIVPIADPTLLAEEAWNELAEAVDYGYMTLEEANEKFYIWFDSHK